MINIAINTFREIVRNKFLYVILFFAFVFILFSLALWPLTIGEADKVVVDFWLAMIEIFWLVWVLFVWSQLLYKEIEGKTIFLILSKPIKRYEFILWKFSGFSATILLIVILQSFLFLLMLWFQSIEITGLIIMSLIFTALKLEILLAIVFFLSTFMSNMLVILVAMMSYFISHWFSHIIDIAIRTKNDIVIYLAQGLQLLFPPMEALNIKDVIGSFTQFSTTFFIYTTYYAIGYIIIILWFSVLIFNRKKFEN